MMSETSIAEQEAQQPDAAKSKREVWLDNVKGLLMVSVVYVHLYDMICKKSGWMYGLRLAILGVQMPLFMFLSGYFGKNLKKRREEALREYAIPFVVLNTLYFLVRHLQGEDFTYSVLRPYNMYWYLLVLILYRLVMENLSQVRGLFPLAIAFALAAGLDGHMGRTLSIARALGFFPFYLMGLYCPKQTLERTKRVPRPAAAALLAVCGMIPWALTRWFRPVSDGSHPYQLVSDYATQGLTWYNGMLMRGSLYVLAPVMGILVLALCLRKRCIFTKIGRNSLEVYLLHAFPMLLVVQLLPGKLKPSVWVFLGLLLYSLVIARLLACTKVRDAYHAVFDRLQHLFFPGDSQPFFPFRRTEERGTKTE